MTTTNSAVRAEKARSIKQMVAPATTSQGAVESGGASNWPELVPFGALNLPRFPAAVLPEWLRKHVEAVAVFTQTPIDLAAMLGLSTLAAAAAKKFRVLVKVGYSEPVNLYTVTVLPPANRKSAVFNEMIRALAECEEEEVSRIGPVIAQAQEQREVDAARLKKLRAEASRDANDEEARARREQAEADAIELARELQGSSVPIRPRLIADDATAEKLTNLLVEHGGRMAVMSPEGNVFDIMAGRYSERGDGNFDVFLKAHAGDTLRVDRISRGSEYVKEPALTLGLTVQPDVIASLSAKAGFRGRGLLGRFLYSLPESMLGRRNVDPPPVPDAVREEYDKNIKALAALPFAEDGGERTAHTLTLSAAARTTWLSFAEEIEKKLAPDAELSNVTDWAGKLVGGVARIAGLLHLAKRAGDAEPWHTPIEDRTMRGAVQIGRYLIPHAQKAFEDMGADADQEAGKQILRWIERGDRKPFSKRDAFQALRGRYKQVADLEPGLGVLEERGFIREAPKQAKTGPGRPASPTYEVNPAFTPQNPHNPQKDQGEAVSEDCGDIEEPSSVKPPTATKKARGKKTKKGRGRKTRRG